MTGTVTAVIIDPKNPSEEMSPVWKRTMLVASTGQVFMSAEVFAPWMDIDFLINMTDRIVVAEHHGRPYIDSNVVRCLIDEDLITYFERIIKRSKFVAGRGSFCPTNAKH